MDDEASGPEAFGRLVSERGVAALPLQQLAALLGAGRSAGDAPPALGLDELVRTTALPRRAVEAALAALGDDVEVGAEGVRLRPEAVARYAGFARPVDEGSGLGGGVATEPPPEALLRVVTEAIAAAPRGEDQVDYVAATAETVARRAVYLCSTFSLSGRRALCLGDRDLTSLALVAHDPTVEVAVADADEAVLAHVAGHPATRGRVACAFADLRLGLPRRLRGWADLVVTDPTYTPEGVSLFARRGLEALADHGTGRLVLAYGWGDQPGLGLEAQEALAELRLAYEAVVPAFNRYVGAQAIGSASSLYVLRPTAGTRRQVARPVRLVGPNAHPRGRQAGDGDDEPLAPAEAAALVEVAEAGGERVGLALGEAWPAGFDPPGTPLAACLLPETPEASPCGRTGGAAVADLRHDGGPLLFRLLLASRAPRLAVLVGDDHPDVATRDGQEALARLLEPKFTLRYLRSHPGPHLAVVEAVARPPAGASPADQARRYVLDRPHAKLANACREALIRSTAAHRDAPLTKNEARALVADHLAGVDTTTSLADLPRAEANRLLTTLATLATPT